MGEDLLFLEKVDIYAAIHLHNSPPPPPYPIPDAYGAVPIVFSSTTRVMTPPCRRKDVLASSFLLSCSHQSGQGITCLAAFLIPLLPSAVEGRC
jgi:hypothetical protein